VIYFERERQHWRDELAKINEIKEGIVRVVGKFLHRLLWATPTKLAFTLVPEDRLDCFTEWYVVGVLIASVGIYLVPYFWLALLSAYVSASTLIVMLHIVLLQRLFGGIKAAERSLLLFICSVAQIVFMFATWYRLGGYSETDALLKSVLTFATNGYAESMPLVAMAQIATGSVVLVIFLGFLLGQFGAKNGGK
jgi:hypothetical protein